MRQVTVTVEDKQYTFKEIAARTGLKVNSANARYRRLCRILGTKNPTWAQLERGTRGYIFVRRLPKKYVCRNALRAKLDAQGFNSTSLAAAIGSTRQYVDRVLGVRATLSRPNALTPEFVTRVCKVLRLDEHETALMHELGAQESGWQF